MYLYQKLNYENKVIKNVDDFLEVETIFNEAKPIYVVYDTETNGLHQKVHKAFLVTFGFKHNVYAFLPTKETMEVYYRMITKPWVERVFSHNAKFDYSMLKNLGYKIPDSVPLGDGTTVARLTSYADDDDSISLETLGMKYVDDNAKFAGKVIGSHINSINKEKKKEVIDYLKENYPKLTPGTVWKEYTSRVKFISSPLDNVFDELDLLYSPANYYDVYLRYPDLMISYALDDVVILMEYLKKALPILSKVDPNYTVFNRECKLIRVIHDMESNGFRVDVDYILKSREKLIDYKTKRYAELWELMDKEFTVGQQQVIKNLFLNRFGVVLEKTDAKALSKVTQTYEKSNPEAFKAASLIKELRTVDKWISTYVDGKLNNLIDGRIYTNINNSGTVSGRISCNLQQEPKEPFYDSDKLSQLDLETNFGLIDRKSDEYKARLLDAELYHPRRMVICDDNSKLYFIDESQMELRVQADYTAIVGSPDTNLCRAYIPYNCYKYIEPTNDMQLFNYNNISDLKSFINYKWYKEEDNQEWTPTDLHDMTTFLAFPFLNNDKSHPDFKHYRRLGKMCNFLKNYQGGIKAIIEQLDVPIEIAKRLDDAYYKAFPNIREYQKWVSRQLDTYGFAENLYGRRYYIRESKWGYKVGNYLIQGTCADMVKTFEIKIDEFLKSNNLKSQMILPIHDEIVFSVINGEEWIIPEIKKIMENVTNVIQYIPMIAEVEYTTTNWGEKHS